MRSQEMFMNDLYFTEHIADDDGSAIATVKLNKDHGIFKGHFPGNPILPGVCMIQIIKELMEKVCNKELQLAEAGNIKYLAFVNPHANNILKFEIQYAFAESGEMSCNALVYYEDTNFCRFKGKFVTCKT